MSLRGLVPLVLLGFSTACFSPRIVPPAGFTLEEYKAACSHAPGAKNWLDGCPRFGPGPLFVIDGRRLPIGTDWWSRLRRKRMGVHARDVASVEVISPKDESGVARYGKNARYGVVVITTKRAVAARTDSVTLAPACYELLPGPWQNDSLLRSIANPQIAPRRFKLDTTRLAGWEPLQDRASFPMYTVHAYPDSGQSADMFTYWAQPRAGSDSIRVSYPLPFAGAGLVVAPNDSGLAGRIYTFTDVYVPGKPSEASRPITARRITCPPGS